MTDRDRLIELITQKQNWGQTYEKSIYTRNISNSELADYLLANGVFILPEDLRGTEDFSISAFIEAMQMYKEKDRYIKPPCKVGDMVYQIKYCRCGNPEAYEMKHCHKKDTKKTPKVYGSIMLLQKGRRLADNSYWYEKPKYEWKPIGTICYKIIQKPFKLEWLTEIGKTVFLTEEEAEAKLKELK